MNFQKYPTFVESKILDMLIGSLNYQRKQFGWVIDELAWKINANYHRNQLVQVLDELAWKTDAAYHRNQLIQVLEEIVS